MSFAEIYKDIHNDKKRKAKCKRENNRTWYGKNKNVQ